MSIRNNSYDRLPFTVQTLQSQIKKENDSCNSFKKASENNKLQGTPEKIDETKLMGFVKQLRITEKIAKEIQDQFAALKSDFDKKIINRARYKAELKPLYDLLVGGDDKVQILNFDTNSIAEELRIAGY